MRVESPVGFKDLTSSAAVALANDSVQSMRLGTSDSVCLISDINVES